MVDYNAYEYILCNIDTIFNYVNIGCNKYYYDDYCKVNLKKKNMIGAPHSLPGWAVMKIRIRLFEGLLFVV